MSSIFGTHIKVAIAGESHGAGLGVIIDGLPAGFPIDMQALSAFLRRRAPGQNAFSTPRKEADTPTFLSGLLENVTTGFPVLATISNTNTRSGDYQNVFDVPRPGHADYTATLAYGGFADLRGGGHFSGRLTAPLCIAGGIALQMLAKKGISVFGHIQSIHGVVGAAPSYEKEDLESLRRLADMPFPAFDTAAGEKMQAEIEKARLSGDSVGGTAEIAVIGLPAGLGAPMFARLEGRMASAAFGVPAVRGIEFGNGFAAASLYGSENNDAFYMDGETVRTRTNRCGGTLGGISTGMPFIYRTCIKPTPSIALEQESVSLSKKTAATLSVRGRHDPCIVPRAIPVLEAVTALVILDALMDEKHIWKEEEAL